DGIAFRRDPEIRHLQIPSSARLGLRHSQPAQENRMSQSSYPIGGPAERTAAKGWVAPPPARWLASVLALAVLLVCAVQLTSYVRAARADGRTGSLAGLDAKVSALAYELESERDYTMLFIALATGPHGARAKSLSPAA